MIAQLNKALGRKKELKSRSAVFKEIPIKEKAAGEMRKTYFLR